MARVTIPVLNARRQNTQFKLLSLGGATGMGGGIDLWKSCVGFPMKALSLKEFYAQSLELKTPWKVVDG
jgi:hypothetical protein